VGEGAAVGPAPPPPPGPVLSLPLSNSGPFRLLQEA
jgi:hypothetical protein